MNINAPEKKQPQMTDLIRTGLAKCLQHGEILLLLAALYTCASTLLLMPMADDLVTVTMALSSGTDGQQLVFTTSFVYAVIAGALVLLLNGGILVLWARIITLGRDRALAGSGRIWLSRSIEAAWRIVTFFALAMMIGLPVALIFAVIAEALGGIALILMFVVILTILFGLWIATSRSIALAALDQNLPILKSLRQVQSRLAAPILASFACFFFAQFLYLGFENLALPAEAEARATATYVLIDLGFANFVSVITNAALLVIAIEAIPTDRKRV